MLKTVKNSKNLYENTGGELKPFFWLGDTAWLLLQKLNMSEIEAYFRNRAERHFNVVQSVLVHNDNVDRGGEIFVDLNNPQNAQAYWGKAAEAAELARKYGIYMAFLPVWGSMVKRGFLTEENAEAYARFLAERFKGYNNIVWVLGGDIRGEQGFDVWNIMGETFKSCDPRRLITFHPFGRTCSSIWFGDLLDFNMFQSGHRRYDQSSLGEWDDNKESEDFYGEDNWRYVEHELRHGTIKPVLDGEPSYEHIPQGLHDFTQPFWQAGDVRRYAYWSVFQGACGHTYGCNSVMQFYSPKDKEAAYNAPEYWTEGINLPGALHMKYLYELMTSVDFSAGSHVEAADNQGFRGYDRITCFAGEDYLLVYNYSGREFRLNIDFVPKEAQWFDPTNGKYTEAAIDPKMPIAPPRNSSGDRDMVLVIRNMRSNVECIV